MRKAPLLSEAGLTLVELVISVALMGVLALGAMELLATVGGESSAAQKRQGARGELGTLRGALQMFLASGDIRFYAFGGGAGANRALSRFIVPRPGLCRDLAATGCERQSTLLYVHHDRRAAPSLPALCQLPGDGGNDRRLVFDFADTSYGKIDGRSLPIQAGTLLAVFDPPRAVLWVATQTARKLGPSQDSAGRISLEGKPFPRECVAGMKADSGQKKKIDELYEVNVKPYLLTQFTGGKELTSAQVNASWGRFPLRVFPTHIRSFGPTPSAAGKGFLVGYSDCKLDSATLDLSCDEAPKVAVDGIEGVSLESAYSVPLHTKAHAASGAERFEVIRPGAGVNASCLEPACLPLPVRSNGQVADLAAAGESFDSLSASEFSLLKQDVLSGIRFRLLLDKVKWKEEVFDVAFP